MKILLACEFTQTVAKKFRERGHEAYSCDLLPTEGNPKWHIQDNVLNHLNEKWDLMIAHPPCNNICVSGARYFAQKLDKQKKDLDFIRALMNCKIPRICIENPVGIISTQIKKPTQIIQPYEFGHGERKTTCLWLKNLPRLYHTSNYYDWNTFKFENVITERKNSLGNMAPSATRAQDRARTFEGIAIAMAEQWGNLTILN